MIANHPPRIGLQDAPYCRLRWTMATTRRYHADGVACRGLVSTQHHDDVGLNADLTDEGKLAGLAASGQVSRWRSVTQGSFRTSRLMTRPLAQHHGLKQLPGTGEVAGPVACLSAALLLPLRLEERFRCLAGGHQDLPCDAHEAGVAGAACSDRMRAGGFPGSPG